MSSKEAGNAEKRKVIAEKIKALLEEINKKEDTVEIPEMVVRAKKMLADLVSDNPDPLISQEKFKIENAIKFFDKTK